MKSFGNTIHWFCYVVAATLLVIGLFDYWFGDHHLTAFLSWAVLAAIPWLVGRASLYVLARRH
jgi:Mg2+/citrate symporter